VQAPNANAYAERWVRTLRGDCLDRCLILSGRHLDHLLRASTASITTGIGRTAPSACTRLTPAVRSLQREPVPTSQSGGAISSAA